MCEVIPGGRLVARCFAVNTFLGCECHHLAGYPIKVFLVTIGGAGENFEGVCRAYRELG